MQKIAEVTANARNIQKTVMEGACEKVLES